jgi:hypothetical protein
LTTLWVASFAISLSSLPALKISFLNDTDIFVECAAKHCNVPKNANHQSATWTINLTEGGWNWGGKWTRGRGT